MLLTKPQFVAFIKQVIDKELSEKKELLDQHDLYEQYLRLSMLKAIDDNWVEQVDYLQQLSWLSIGQSASQKKSNRKSIIKKPTPRLWSYKERTNPCGYGA